MSNMPSIENEVRGMIGLSKKQMLLKKKSLGQKTFNNWDGEPY